MIEVKRVEVRDRMTFIPALAMRFVGGPEEPLLWRAGFGAQPYVLLVRLTDTEAHYSAYDWRGTARTMPEAHRWLAEHWDEHQDGAVLDVEYVLGERETPKVSELV